MSYQASQISPFLKGIVASNQPLAQPKGALSRSSNLILLERGAVTPCDGSAIINYFSGAVQNNRGRMLACTLFAPTGVTPYYLVLAKDTGQQLGAPKVLTAADGGAGGTLAAATYFYKVTALDGVGGETLVSNEASQAVAANHKINLTWNTVPNAYGYNIYRSTVTNTEVLTTGIGVPVLQPSSLALTVTFTDTGQIGTPSYSIATWSRTVSGGVRTITFTTTIANNIIPGSTSVTISGTTAALNGVYVFNNKSGNSLILTGVLDIPPTTNISGTGGTAATGGISPPVADTTQQTVLYLMPAGSIPITYTEANIVAYYPASPSQLGVAPSGSSGLPIGTQSSTPSGGIVGLVSMIPQFKQFTNRMVIALGNGYIPQLFWDSMGTTVNAALTGAITSVAVSGDQVTYTASATTFVSAPGITTNLPIGSWVLITNSSDSTYNGVFQVLATGTHAFTVRNTAASGGASTGTFTVSTSPLYSRFVPAYPAWINGVAYPTGSIIVPKTQPSNANIYLTALQGGITGSTEPTWPNPLAVGQQFPLGNIADNNGNGTIIWQESGYLNSAAPPPPGAGHIEVYANSLWVWNTYPTNTLNGLDGPCSLRMSGQGSPNTWNPINQAFLDKDDGFEGMGLAKFTITALGIPPEGSLVAFKNRTPYQIIGVFGAANFAIQAVSSDMGCIAPRTVLFVPGYGIGRYTHMGFSIFDGTKDTLISEQIRPYLFTVNDLDALDITATDPNFIPISWAALTSNPPQYTIACPVGMNSLGQLTRIFIYDLVLKAWMITDLPFSISCMAQVQPFTSSPITIMGGYLDGCLQRWQAGDIQWYTGGGNSVQSVAWSCRTLTIASQDSSQRIYMRRFTLRGTNTGAADTITIQPRRSTITTPTVVLLPQRYPITAAGDFDIFADIGLTGLRFDVAINSTAHVEIDGATWHLEPRPIGSIAGVI